MRTPLLAVLATVVTTCSVVPALTAPATAADAPTTHEAVLFATDSNGDGGYGLHWRTPTGQSVLVPESDGSDVYAVAASRDSRRMAYLQDVYDSEGEITHERLVVRDMTLRGTPSFTRVVSDLLPSDGAVLDLVPALSPDGSTVVWTRVDANGGDIALRTMAAGTASGTPRALAAGVTDATFLDAQTLLGIGETGGVSFPLAGGAQQPVEGLTSADSDLSVSPDGSSVAFVRDTTTEDSLEPRAEVHVADLAVTEGVVSLEADRVLDTATGAATPVFSADGSTVTFSAYDGEQVAQAMTAPADGSASASVRDLYGDVIAVATAVVDSVAPQPVLWQTATVDGGRVTVRWTLPADTDLAGVEVTNGHRGFVLAPGTSWTDTLAIRGTYTYYAQAVDKAGNLSAQVAHTVTMLPLGLKTPAFPDPTSVRYYLNPAFRVALPEGPYTVQYRANGTGPLVTWLASATGTSQVFSAARAGSSYGFLLTRYDAYGNESVFRIGTAVVPYDQSRASYSGSYVTQTLNERYLGNATILRTAGSAARLVVNGNRLQVIGEKCTSCGVMDVYVDGKRVAGVDTHDTQRRSRQVLYTRAITAGVNHTVVIKARGTAGHPNVVLDAFGVRH